MSEICILTDSTAQFPVPLFEGRHLVNIISLDVQLDGKQYSEAHGLKAADMPISTRRGFAPRVIPPSVKQFEEMFIQLGKRYSDILCVLHSSQLTKTVAHAYAAAENAQGRARLAVIDSHTISLGLGLIVQTAAEAAVAGTPLDEIEQQLRNLLPQIYTVFTIQGLSYLLHSGYLSYAQAVTAEYLKVLPIFTMEGGTLTPTQKARNYRHLVDILHEFMWEFSRLKHIAILQGVPSFEQETRALRERIALDFEDTPVSEHTISATLAALIGPRSLGLFVLQ